MGSRAAVIVANNSKGTQLDSLIKGVICLSYPLIGSGKGDLRDAPLLQLSLPTLFVSGDRDPMCPKDKMLSTLRQCDNPHSIHWIQGSGHGFGDTKGKKVGETIQAVCDQVGRWCGQICSGHLDSVVAAVGCEGKHPLVSQEDKRSCDMKEGDGSQQSKLGQKSRRNLSVYSSTSSGKRKSKSKADQDSRKVRKHSVDSAETRRLRSKAKAK